MATITIDVPDECAEALACCNFLALDAVAAKDFLHEATHGLAERLGDMAARLQAIYDRGGNPDDLRALALEAEGMDVPRRIRSIASGLDAF